jgi:hypothetical protein
MMKIVCVCVCVCVIYVVVGFPVCLFVCVGGWMLVLDECGSGARRCSTGVISCAWGCFTSET